MKILCGTSSRHLGNDLAIKLNIECVQANVRRFPDHECYVRIEREGLDKEVVIVQNTYPDNNIIELLFLIDAARSLGAEKVTCVIPYFGYSRQDKRFNPGEALSAQVMLRHLEMDTDRIITIDLHKPEILNWVKRIPAKDLHSEPAIGRFFMESDVDLVLAPDKGADKRAEEVGLLIGVEFDHLVKTRLSGSEVKITPSQIDAKNKNVLIVDDIISTGGTIIAATNELKRLGAKNVFAACTHGLFIGGALEKLKMTCDRVVSTNTIESEVSKISVAEEIAKVL